MLKIINVYFATIDNKIVKICECRKVYGYNFTESSGESFFVIEKEDGSLESITKFDAMTLDFNLKAAA